MFSSVHGSAREEHLSRYLHEIRSFPMLSAEEELTLARRWRDGADVNAANKLVTSHLRLVAKIAMGYRGYGLPVSDLISEGCVGMVNAAKRFDPDRGFRLSTYAMWWIRAAMQEYVLRSWSLVRLGTTAAQKTLFFNLHRLKREMQMIDDGDLTPEQATRIAEALDVPEQEVVCMNRRMAASDCSLNAPAGADGTDERQNLLEDQSESQDEALASQEEIATRKALLAGALETLTDRQRHILLERRLKETPTTLEKLSLHHGISRERIRQIEQMAISKLQKSVKAQLAARDSRSASIGFRQVAQTTS